MITVFGSINLDLIGGVERLPRPGETVAGASFVTAPGGKGANQALAAARAGAEVRMVGAVGRDGFADPALALLAQGGLDLARVRKVPVPTGVALILVEGSGENVIAVIPGANGELAAADAQALDFGPRDLLLLQFEVPLAAMAAAARRAKASGAPVILNAAPFRREALDLLPQVTHLVVNESECALIAEAAGLSGDAVEAEAAALAAKYAVTTIVTLGADGVLAVSDGRTERAAALAVTAVDTVGAGDTFCGYFAAALVEGRALADALAVASAAGSLACTRSGAQPSIPRREEVEAVLRAGAH